ncbi:saccharopine dehydrogenase family protein [Acaryochloris marina]|uniref:Saccharopine dehydrogenase n=1 Tax=Acaryochloris marina (strain MBIC 11017) TaxID=329726 RepID=B0CFA0_ACAM1|nr:saccharopine dehydrogenase NADP-binding domain-containing protein [Acaryochloris marina]ABW25787.1 saccharopine dehydrogenase [Acaryochloris marina MBIC11017]
MSRVLVIGGGGRIGQSVASDLVKQLEADVTLTSRDVKTVQEAADGLASTAQALPLDLDDWVALDTAISSHDLVIHCAGPFHDRDARVLKSCIQNQVNYLDVSDHPSFTEKALQYQEQAQAAGVTAIINTGVFPGISNSMVRQDVEALDQPDTIHLSYVVAGTGGAGVTIMRTTFLGLIESFPGWLQGKWQPIQPYSGRETITFPSPYGRVNVFWFDVPERLTLPQTFPVQSVITKFGSVPEIYNGITWALAHWMPKSWLQNRRMIEFLSWGGFVTTQFTDRFSGVGVAMRSAVTGMREGQPTQAVSTLALPDTAIAAGYGTGSIAQLILTQTLEKPGVWPVEAAVPTSLFQQTMAQRNVQIEQVISSVP